MAILGHLSLLLHAHLPYVRHAEHPDFLEEDWLYEAVVECYVPLLRALERLDRDGVPWRLALTLTPTLCAMFEDPLLQDRASARLGGLVELSERLEVELRGGPFGEAIQHQARALRETWWWWEERAHRRLLPIFRAHAEAGRLEILGCSATHAILPLLATDAGRRAQVRAGQREHLRHFGRLPEGMWLAECAWTPALDGLLEGTRWTVVDAHGLSEGHPPARHSTHRPVSTPAGRAVFGRDPSSSEAVWSGRVGYPGHPSYREFYRDVGYDEPYATVRPYLHADGVRRALGIKLHRITGEVPLSEKAPYQPGLAEAQAHAHAADFVSGRIVGARAAREALGLTPHALAPYDAELFGHWWAEGPVFLEATLRALAGQAEIDLLTPSELLERHPPATRSLPGMSSWGEGGYFSVWLNPTNAWIWRHLHRAEERMIALSWRYAGRPGAYGRALAAAGRELLLAQSSDWPFILTTQTSPAYAERRLREHLARFHALATPLELGRVDAEALARSEAACPLFPDLDGSEWLPPERWTPPRPPEPPRPGAPLRAILFDFNGVIADDEPLHLRAIQRVMAPRGVDLDEDTYFARYLGLDDRGIFGGLMRDRGLALDAALLHELIEEKARVYAELALYELEAVPGTLAFIARAAEVVPLAIVSGALGPEIHFAVARFGIADRFEAIVSADQMSEGKPSPEGYNKGFAALARTRPELRPEHCMVIEDAQNGVTAARAAGMIPVALRRGPHAGPLRGEATSVDSLLDWDPMALWARAHAG